MKHTFKQVFLLFGLMMAAIGINTANAQTQLELSTGSYPSAPNGATVANQTATKLENTTGTTFVAYSPSITVTASFTNQQYATIPVGVVSTGTGMVYGASTNSLGTAAVSLPIVCVPNATALQLLLLK